LGIFGDRLRRNAGGKMINWIYKWLAARMIERRLAELAGSRVVLQRSVYTGAMSRAKLSNRTPYKIGR
jgi:hypothetical protein